MPDFLLDLDRHLFYIINHEWANPFFDTVLPVMRNAKFWIPLYVFIIGFSIWRYKKQGAVMVLFLALSAGFADFTSASIIKPAVHRLRPCRDPYTSAAVISRVPCGTGYSFPSTHATDHFAIAIFLGIIFYKRHKWIMPLAILWAATISFAQVYVGVHFPVDVVLGALYGSLVGWLFAFGFTWYQRNTF
ncbi:phosphatase PAP2 family protein [Mucilaginibacter sp. 21P]|uniref:phosphatase PAP2 family protein n=1 Tax=Mucilaginibacter sp. 21P TaxID=2778902 RepID=UPI001C593A78|nr:phosphatase PAP2 family protein [Mucilaginibacter sp. 21P]QXV65071.1 phosphatase PAP2 family protein [Mucilaginibacter sp. 21P]